MKAEAEAPVSAEVLVGGNDASNARLKAEESKLMAEMRKAHNDQKKKAKRQVYVTKPGFVWNPLLKYPRNEPCPCGSGKKFKKCHLDQLPQAIPKGTGKDARIVAKKQPSPPAQPANEEVQQPTTEKSNDSSSRITAPHHAE